MSFTPNQLLIFAARAGNYDLAEERVARGADPGPVGTGLNWAWKVSESLIGPMKTKGARPPGMRFLRWQVFMRQWRLMPGTLWRRPEWYYQVRALRRIGEAFETDCDRKALVVMATGAGKTRTIIALCDLLMRCNWIKRVLFLADRVALAADVR